MSYVFFQKIVVNSYDCEQEGFSAAVDTEGAIKLKTPFVRWSNEEDARGCP